MAITYKGLQSIEGGIDGKDASTSSTLTFLSECDQAPLTIGDLAISAAVSAASGISIGSVYPFDSRSYCRRISSRCTNRRASGNSPVWHWLTTIEFSSATDSGGAGGSGGDSAGPVTQGGFGNPTLRPPKISLSLRHSDVPVKFDINDRICENTAGDPIVRTKKTAQLIVRWEKYMRRWDWRYNLPAVVAWPAVDLHFLYSRNLRPWSPAGVYTPLLGDTKVAPGCAQMQSITSEISFADGGCVFVAVDIAIDDNEFIDKFLDQGFFFLATPGVSSPEDPNEPRAVVRRRFVDRNGVMTGPQLLNGAGRPLPDGQPPVEIERQYYQLRDWDAAPWGPVSNTGKFFSYPIG